MRVPRIYLDQELRTGERIALDAQAAVHVARVLRLGEGDRITVFNGRGGEYSCVIETVKKREVQVLLQEYADRSVESPLKVVLAQGVSKGERMDVTVQKAVELGISGIVPLITHHSVVNLNAERKQKRRAHWQAIARSACEQCGRNTVPVIEPVTDFTHWIDKERSGTKLVLHHRASHDLNNFAVNQNEPVTALVGPEGGLSEDEITRAEQAGFQSVRLGPRVLRTETAALVLLSALQTLWGDFQ